MDLTTDLGLFPQAWIKRWETSLETDAEIEADIRNLMEGIHASFRKIWIDVDLLFTGWEEETDTEIDEEISTIVDGLQAHISWIHQERFLWINT